MYNSTNPTCRYVDFDTKEGVCDIIVTKSGTAHEITIRAINGYIIDAEGEPIDSIAITLVPDLTLPRVGTRLTIGGRLVEVAKKPWRDEAGALWIADAISGQNVRYE